MPKDKSRDNQKQRHDPLYKDLTAGHGSLREQPRAKEGRKKSQQPSDSFVNAKTSKKILAMAKEQQDEVEEEEYMEDGGVPSSYKLEDLEDEDQLQWYDEESDDEGDYEDDEEFQEIQEIEIEEGDEDLFRKYMGNGGDDAYEDEEVGAFGGTGNQTLADKIMAKVREKEAAAAQTGPVPRPQQEQEGVMLPPKVIETFTKVGELLTNYRSGRLPKVFKMVPSLKNWEDVLYVMQPESWSPHAVYQATRLFVSNLHADQARKFIESVLLERFRDDIQENKTLNYHLYRALKKSLYKPAAFFKGFLFPLCESGTCSLKEAAIVGSILSKVSIPILHSAVALLRLCEMEYSGSNSFFIKTLFEKKYALPYRVVDAAVFHFMQFRVFEGKKLPVVWHQSFLAFAQRYKNDITLDQRDGLLDVVKCQMHPSIGPEIRRELLSGKPRGEENAMELS